MDSYNDKLTKLNQEAHASTMQQITENMCPVLSQPYLHVEDAMCEAPERALILWDVTNGTYQFMEVEPHINTHGKLRALVNGVQEVADLCCVAFNVGDGWDHWRD